MSMHKILLLGNLGKAFELKTTKDGKSWATASLAVSTKVKGDKVTTWYKLKAFGKAAEILTQYADKGQTLYVEGVPQAEAWLPNGTTTPMSQVAVLVQEFKLLGGGKAGDTPRDEQAQAINDAQGNDDLEWL